MQRRFKLLCSALCASTLSSVLAVKVNVEVGFEHPDVHIDGFVLSEVHVHGAHFGGVSGDVVHTLTRRQLSFKTHPHLVKKGRKLNSEAGCENNECWCLGSSDDGSDRCWDKDQCRSSDMQGDGCIGDREVNAIDASASRSRDKIRGLAKLIFANNEYDAPRFYFSKSNYPIDEGDFYYVEGLEASTLEASNAKTKALWDAAREELEFVATASYKAYDTPAEIDSKKLLREEPVSVARQSIGIACLMFTDSSGDTILAFRDTSSPGDYKNIDRWIQPAVVDTDAKYGMTQNMKRHWTEGAQLEWGAEQIERENAADIIARTTLKSAFTLLKYKGSFNDDLVSKVNGVKIGGEGPEVTITKGEAVKYGYWPITKQIVEEVRRETNEKGHRLLFTGHSQGGGRAQLARMYLEKKYNEKPPVITFGAVGAACFPRNPYGKGTEDYLDDVDPAKAYTDVFDYAHPLDPWGSALGADIGETCHIGVSTMADSMPYKYCSRVYGYSAPYLLYEENVKQTEFGKKFKACRYFTHTMPSIIHFLSMDSELDENGIPAGGCVKTAVITDGGECPVHVMSMAEKALAAGAVVLIVGGCVLFLCLLGTCFCYLMKGAAAVASKN